LLTGDWCRVHLIRRLAVLWQRHETPLTAQGFPWRMLERRESAKEESVSTLEKTSWKTMELEKLNERISRQMISGENATLSQLLLKQGAVVPRHSHVNEQYSWIISGALKFIFDDREILVGAGEVLLIPAHVPHSAVALEDTVDVDFFAPRREDWIQKEDSYLRG
jgi:quercetin dioxygenase-like cupin family protein